jgi:hypothetical protein
LFLFLFSACENASHLRAKNRTIKGVDNFSISLICQQPALFFGIRFKGFLTFRKEAHVKGSTDFLSIGNAHQPAVIKSVDKHSR